METFDLFQRMSVALAVGLLIGLERGWKSRSERDGERAAGLRTFALTGLLGGIWGAIAVRFADAGGVIALALAFVVLSAAMVLFMLRQLAREGSYSATSAVAAMVTFALGALATLGDMRAAAAAGVAAAMLLALRAALHEWIERISWEELRSALVLLAMTFIALPILPDRTIDPWDSLNPHLLWLMTILIAALSFAGYIAIKLTGDDRGVLLTGIAGGLASSTAVTLSLSSFAKDNPGQAKLLVSGMLAACATMMARVLVIASAVNIAMLEALASSIAAAGVVLAGGAWALARLSVTENDGNRHRLTLGNPFDLGTVVKFGALLAAITLGAKLATAFAGKTGAYALAAASGLADVDAITLSMSRLGVGSMPIETGVNAVLIAIGVNTVVKTAIAWTTGGAAIGYPMALVSALSLAAGLAARALSVGW